MQQALEISVRDVANSGALDAHIRLKARRLEHFYSTIVGCNVAVEQRDGQKRQGKLFTVKIDIKAPGSELVVNHHQHHEDVYVASRDAYGAARRILEDYAGKQHGDVNTHSPVPRP